MIVYAICALAAIGSFAFISYKFSKEIKILNKAHEADQDMIVHMSQVVSDLSEHLELLGDSVNTRFESLEDYLKIIKAETENEKHPDYWASVMNYNPLLHKEPEE